MFFCVFFFFKQKTAYEMRISDWSSDVCSSDLQIGDYIAPNARQLSILERGRGHGLASGFTMPIRMRDEPDAMFTVARQGDKTISGPDLLSARLIGTVAFDQARALQIGRAHV